MKQLSEELLVNEATINTIKDEYWNCQGWLLAECKQRVLYMDILSVRAMMNFKRKVLFQ